MKPIDNSKIERIKKETRKLIVEKGYHGASIAELARRAQVSDGYLYRHYKNKSELVQDVFETQLKTFHDFIFDSLKRRDKAIGVVEDIVHFLFKLSKTEPDAIHFAHSLVYDFEFEYPQSRSLAIDEMSKILLKLGKDTGEFCDETRVIDVQLTILTIPVKFIEYSNRGYCSDRMSDDEEMRLLVKMCMNALR
ncbi:TetR/AcrR family transcriptional regulator [Ancylomarina sp. DW003]|nr:TetR/AcrR family transcriptional regulator [Ancylomarina sp. DW003]MDE5423276.1 TetR/AcrR family transcriptional regulator [Ancylomarina sp. DW003]